MRPARYDGLWFVVDYLWMPRMGLAPAKVLDLDVGLIAFRNRHDACRWIDRHTPREES